MRLLVLLSLGALSSFAADLGKIDWETLQKKFLSENPVVQKDFVEKAQWNGALCNGFYNYLVHTTFKPTDFQTKLNDASERSLHVDASFQNLYFGVKGNYKSELSACVRIPLNIGLSSDYAHVTGNIILVDNGDDTKIQVQVLSVEFGTIHLGRHVPKSFEKFVTSLVNRAFAKVWASKLGEWLDAQISDEINRNTPRT